MKIDEKFNKRSAELIEVQYPSIRFGRHLALGMCIEFFCLPGKDGRTLKMHLTPDEALQISAQLTEAARKAIAISL